MEFLKKIPFFDGELNLGKICTRQKAESLFYYFLNHIPWKTSTILFFGNEIIEPRLTCWMGDESAVYTYARKTKIPTPWDKRVVELKKAVEEICGDEFNSCLLNLYRDGNDSMGWHSDNEKELGTNPCIASLSFGAERWMHFKHKTQKNIPSQKFFLESGSILIMSGETQKNWKHQIPKSKKITKPRVNLTFRKIIN